MESCQTLHINSAGDSGKEGEAKLSLNSLYFVLELSIISNQRVKPQTSSSCVSQTFLVGCSQLVASTASPQADKWGLHCFYYPQYVVYCAVNAQWQEKFLLKLMQGIAEVSKRPQTQMWGIWFSLLVNLYTGDKNEPFFLLQKFLKLRPWIHPDSWHRVLNGIVSCSISHLPPPGPRAGQRGVKIGKIPLVLMREQEIFLYFSPRIYMSTGHILWQVLPCFSLSLVFLPLWDAPCPGNLREERRWPCTCWWGFICHWNFCVIPSLSWRFFCHHLFSLCLPTSWGAPSWGIELMLFPCCPSDAFWDYLRTEARQN